MKSSADPNSSLWIGARRGASEDRVSLPLGSLLRHAMALGSSGSGKTVLCKSIVEEVVRARVPAICIDPQGDLCSLAADADPQRLQEKGIDPELARAFRERAEVVVFTPASQKGVSLCADPVERGAGALEPAERTQVLGRTAAMVAALLGYDAESDDGAGLIAVLDTVLNDRAQRGAPLSSLAELSACLAELETQGLGDLERLLESKKLHTACQRMARLGVGARRLLFHEGLPIDIPMLLGWAGTPGYSPGKTRVSIIYLNTLGSQEDKDFFVAALVNRLYSFMLAHPSPTPQALFYIDEVAPFVPPVRKPACKDALMQLFKQARKYGVSCLMATQNPGDIDYKAMAQFGTWALGRMTTRQDLKKIEPSVKSLAPVACESLLQSLPGLDPGQFVLISPDNFDSPVPLTGRWLYSAHETWDEEQIAAHSAQSRKRFAGSRDAATGLSGAEERAALPGKGATSGKVARKKGDAPALAEREDRRENAALPMPAVAPEEPAERRESTPPRSPRISAKPQRDFFETGGSAEGKAATREDTRESVVVAKGSRQELENWCVLLAAQDSLSVQEFSEHAGMGEKKGRSVLKSMVEAGLAKTYREGRSQRYYLVAAGGRPDLGLGKRVLVAAARIDPEGAYRLGESMLRGSILGFGPSETFERAELHHRAVYKLDFEERVARDMFSRWAGKAHDLMMGSVYLHPVTLDVLALAPQGMFFSPRPAEHASAISDLDGATHSLEAAPAALNIDEEEWGQRQSPEAAKRSFQSRYAAQPGAITPLFVPLWRILFRTASGTGYRVVTLDAILGRPVEWPHGAKLGS